MRPAAFLLALLLATLPLAAQDGDVTAQVQAARKLYDDGHADRAIEILRGLVDDHPAETIPLLAFILFDAKNETAEPARLLAEYLELVPGNEWALDLLSIVAVRALDRGEAEVARACAKVLMLQQPGEKEHRYLWAEASYRLGRRDSVHAETRALIRDYPSFESPYWLLAKVLEDEGRYEDAVAVYRDLLKESSGNVGARLTRASLLLWQLRDYDAAEREYRAAAEIAAPDSPDREDARTGLDLVREARERSARLARHAGFLRTVLAVTLGAWALLLLAAALGLRRAEEHRVTGRAASRGPRRAPPGTAR
jgi:tetratricopeptide (TPR) repeat protein